MIGEKMSDIYNPKTIFDKTEEGDSQIYVGIKYLQIVGDQILQMRNMGRIAWNTKGDSCFLWLHELRLFYALIESRTDLHYSEKEIDSSEYKVIDNLIQEVPIKIKEKEKYPHWFREIELMIERNSNVMILDKTNIYNQKKYINDKKILNELDECMRELMLDANRRHLIMPEGMKDMKQLAKDEWIDRDIKKSFGNHEGEF